MPPKSQKIEVEMIPTGGASTKKTVEIDAKGTVADALKAADIDPKGKNFEVDGNPVALDAKIADHHVAPKVTARVIATERVSGS